MHLLSSVCLMDCTGLLARTQKKNFIVNANRFTVYLSTHDGLYWIVNRAVSFLSWLWSITGACTRSSDHKWLWYIHFEWSRIRFYCGSNPFGLSLGFSDQHNHAARSDQYIYIIQSCMNHIELLWMQATYIYIEKDLNSTDGMEHLCRIPLFSSIGTK
jgi:hypothetical protein